MPFESGDRGGWLRAVCRCIEQSAWLPVVSDQTVVLAQETRYRWCEGTLTGKQDDDLIHNPNSLLGVGFRYSRWLCETEQWEAMELFSFVIHPALGRLAGMGKTRIADLTPEIVNRTLLVAAQDHLDHELAYGAWADFVEFLEFEGIPYPDNLLAS